MSFMSLSHRDVSRPSSVDRTGEHAGVSPTAQRVRVHRWRDPRLWLGVVLVLASVATGSALFARGHEAIVVWSVTDDLRAGMEVTAADLRVERVDFADASTAGRYWSATEPPPDHAVLTRDLAAGELLAVDAVRQSGHRPDQLPLGVDPRGVPAGLQVGTAVDVWAVPSSASGAGDERDSVRVLAGVTVTAMSGSGPGGLDSQRQVLVALPDRTPVGEVLDGLRDADVVLVRVSG